MSRNTYPGKHPQFKLNKFSPDVQKILEVLSKEFFLTNDGDVIQLGKSSRYEYIILEPTADYEDAFNLNKEILVIFSPYEALQPRTLDAFEKVSNKFSTLRLEKICGILISKDQSIELSLSKLIRSEPESQIIIPFTYNELEKTVDANYIKNRFRKHFYSRDLFAFEAPLRKDLYFFGRNDLIQTIIGRYKSGENSGLFGLRKTGKTSIINGIERSLKREGIIPIVIDCQNPSFNQRRWFEAIHYICKEAKEKLNLSKVKLGQEQEFDCKNASSRAELFFKRCRLHTAQPLFFIFDEIENISIKTSLAMHWRNGEDFVLFWQTLRSIFQKGENTISYLIVGTNPSCIEMPKIESVDNPIFNHFSPLYVPGFDVQDTKEMVNKLGNGMGLKFDDTIHAKLTEDFGGHPFLIRHVCSSLSKELEDSSRPVKVDRKTYQIAKQKFIASHSHYLDMILGVLKDFYSDELEMLTYLANEDYKTFNEFASMHSNFTQHLLGYGLIEKTVDSYDFKIDSIRDYLIQLNRYKRPVTSIEDKWQEISIRRNSIEPKLRNIVKRHLKATKGIADATATLLSIVGSRRAENLTGLSYSDLFDPQKGEIYFSDLIKIISKEWEIFKNIFSNSKKEMFNDLQAINQYRADAHAKEISDSEFSHFRVCIEKIEADIEDYEQ